MFVLSKFSVLVMFVIVVTEVSCSKKLSRDHRDDLMLARCEAKCWNLHKKEKNKCISSCLMTVSNPGRCALPYEMTEWESACIKACVRDIHCPSMGKCCQHGCGTTCHEPRGLQEIPGLPAIPQKVAVFEGRRGRDVRVSWSSPNESPPIFYVLEERHHVGRHFSESRLDKWTPRQRSMRPNIPLKNVVKPGRWYQFRVAAVNQNGTRGFSKPTFPFTPSHGPRSPSIPQNLSVSNLAFVNGSLGATFRWKRPNSSDLPIHKYKVFWSHRLQGVDHVSDSVIVHHHTVGKDQTSFELKDLQPHSLYFLQVQALAPFGSTRLKSEKAALVLNTTNFSNESLSPFEGNGLKRSLEHHIEGLHLHRMKWMKTSNQLVAYIAWRPVASLPGKQIRYNIQWWTTQCEGNNENSYKKRAHDAAITDATKFKLHDLIFGCKYIIKANTIIGNRKSTHSSEITFKSPTCEQTRLKWKSDKIECQ